MATDQKTSFSVEDQYKMPFFNAEAQPSPPPGVKVTEAKKNNTAESNRIHYVCTRNWSRGRAVRQRSAKPCTAVRICSRPQRKAPYSTKLNRGFFFFMDMQARLQMDIQKKNPRASRRLEGAFR
jgi:hypothetical protein